jgi:hypothetical protein
VCEVRAFVLSAPVGRHRQRAVSIRLLAPLPARRIMTAPTERRIQHDVRLAASEHADLVLWRNSTGVTQEDDRAVRYGLCVGSSDLIGVLGPAGRFVAIEIKSERGRLSIEQQLFLSLVRRMGGFATTVRSVGEFHAAIQRARAGESE